MDVRELELGGGRVLRTYDAGGGSFPVFWLHGTPNVGTPPAPLFPAAERLGVRWVSYDRPGYGGSSPRPGRDVASAAGDVAAVADALGLGRFGVMGHSGGAPHALACGALLPERVTGVVAGAGLAPFGAAGLGWFDGMGESAAASLRAAARGRAAKEAYTAAAGGDEGPEFTEADLAALAGAWGWFGEVVGPAVESGPGPLIDDDLAYVAPWGFDPAGVRVPVLLLHGERDRMVPAAHSRWLADHCRGAELWQYPEDGHISVLHAGEAALAWLCARRDAA
ncbi:alpha/beta fold hydrolase [Streptomyces johnsoniae]|uniref:Alpha/beta hydrolase n=1 Tax=Streptomyces johnsoniae TaxID=3075532 RepID=A0ABU2S843_9ACTN|nr:alpha/beta hydrolase [Streptomyces sp. DSM 41886]MDT0445146.1 alpha/beta hydrolase [Streptomyces sp. DSM 41886]